MPMERRQGKRDSQLPPLKNKIILRTIFLKVNKIFFQVNKIVFGDNKIFFEVNKIVYEVKKIFFEVNKIFLKLKQNVLRRLDWDSHGSEFNARRMDGLLTPSLLLHTRCNGASNGEAQNGDNGDNDNEGGDKQ